MSQTTRTTIHVKVDGSEIAADTMDFLIDLLVEDDLEQPAMAVLRFHDPQYALMDGSTFNLGKSLEISAKTNNTPKTIFKGEVISLEPELSQESRSFVVRAYDKLHRLYRKRQTRTFLNKTDSAIASQIAQENGIQADVQATTESHAYVIQGNLSDIEFLRQRAERIGYRVRADDTKLVFKKAEQSPSEAATLEWGTHLLEFNARLSLVAQPNEVEVRSWNPQTKQAIVGSASTATNPHQLGESRTGGALAQSALGSSAKVVVSDLTVRTQGEATAVAQSLLNAAANDYLTAEGMCLGNPAIKAGVLVKITGIGTKFSGKYFVTSSRHTYTPHEGYLTVLIANGFQATSVSAQLAAERPRGGIAGVTTGIVTNINDPDGLGRVKLKFPWLHETQESDWAWMAAIGGGNQRGFMMLPEVNDQVVVAFENGDLSRPFVVGGLWSSQDAVPATAVENGKVTRRALRLRAGHSIEFQEDEGANKGSIIIKTADSRQITISDNDKKIEIKSQKHTVTMDDTAGSVSVQAQTSLELKCGANKLAMSSAGIELSGSGGKLNIAAAGVDLTANANLGLKANANCDLQANAMMNVKSSAILNIQGTLVKIN